VTTTKLHPKYASSITGSDYKRTKVDRPSDDKNAGPIADNKNSNNKEKSASNVYEERFLFGMASDFVKNVAKIMTGSLFTDLLKGVLKDKKYTWEKVLYDTLVDSGPSRLFTDYINSFAVRTLSFLPPEVSSQIFAMPSVVFFRAATSGSNVNANSAAKNMSPEEEEMREQILKKPFVRWIKNLSGFFQTKVQPKLNFAFEKLLGVTAGKELLDAEGNKILDEKGKVIKTNPKVALKRLMTTAGAFLAGTAFLPRHTKATGSDLVKTPLRATINTISTSLFRLNTTLLHNGVGAHVKGGANFNKCFDASVQEKTLVPLIQYSADNIGALLSKYIPLNGAILGILTRVITEVPGTFLSSGLVNFAEGDRLTEKWRLLGQRVWLPVTRSFREVLKPLYRFLARNVYSKLGGMFDPKIKNMYDADIGKEKPVELDPELDKKYAKGIIPTTMMLVQETLGLFAEIPKLLKDCAVQSDIKVQSDLWTQKSVNRRIDFFKQHGFRAPTHATEEQKANLTEAQRKRVEQIEQKELSRGFKMQWNEEKQAYQKISVPLPSIEDDEDDAKVDVQNMRTYHEGRELVKANKQKTDEERGTQEFLLQQAA
jgi:hypothetical protein